jgi:hypothetical protein
VTAPPAPFTSPDSPTPSASPGPPTPGTPAAPGQERAAFAIAFAGYVLVTVALTRPLAWQLSSKVPHDLGDPLLSTALLWWNAHVLPLTTRWWDGFAFWPASGMLAFSDHRLGESLLASPLQWAGLSALTAYNITLLATFPLCAIAAHWLAFTLTGRHDASLIAGLAYGFSPYRVAHIEHLELLAAFGMPAALAALHLYVNYRRLKWLVVLGGALLLQALTCSYYFLFFSVMLALWAAWFLRRRDGAVLVGIGASEAAVVVLLSPVAWGYRAIHHQYALARGGGDIVTLSADLTSFFTASPLVAAWGWTSSLNGPERQLFPGAALAVLIVVGTIAAMRSRPSKASENRLSFVLTGLACVPAMIAASAWHYGPWHIGAFLSVGAPFKPFSLAFWALVAALAASPWARGAYRRRSAFAFYILAAAMLFLCSLGPKPALLRNQFLYEPPYAWLMRISVFGESIRVPARFAMPGILALSVAGALAFARLTRRQRSGPLLACVIGVAVLADTWPAHLPLLDPPPAWSIPEVASRFTAFVELPLGPTDADTTAMYRASLTHLPTINGYSGYYPTHYDALRRGLEERDDSMLEALASRGPILVVVDRRTSGSEGRLEWLGTGHLAKAIAADADRTFFEVGVKPVAPARCGASVVPIAGVQDSTGPVDLGKLTDHDESTYWISSGPQQAGDLLLLDLGQVRRPCSIQLSLGIYVSLFPRLLSVATSEDLQSWRTSFLGSTGGKAALAAAAHPLTTPIEIELPRAEARFIRLRLEAGHPTIPWIVTELAVTAAPGE